MHPQIQQIVDSLESQRETILKEFRGFNAEQFHRAPRQGKWSAAQILSHIITAERMSVAYMQKKLQGIDQASRSGILEEVKFGILKVSQRLPGLKFKAPARVVENTTLYKDLASIEAEWKTIRTDLQNLVEKIPDHHLDRMIYKHPIAGYLNVAQALKFLREHIVHHTPQLKRLLK
jgi:DinB superfamily